ncbi:hypothetical protein D8674_021895 [Pyrus ussuriensis x Pyrus communis]|uniref:Uncharacterized protein n=1 Tax=Pyrus ussuriensis x Pyrus communis TaxID=2448454 RepID=A0A5N5GJJ8_9ROSA|nr:hypothetical protein D8674_021895 [Pyrus ussuriensis x Pyrus communis]
MAPLFPNARIQLFCNTSEPFVPAVDHEVIGPMMLAPTNIIATKVPTQENLVPILTANHEDPDFWCYLQANFHVEVKYEQNPTLQSGANQQFESPAKTIIAWGEWNDFSHGSNMLVYPPQSPNPLINIYYPRCDEAAKNVILKDENFPSDLPSFGVNVLPPWSNEISFMKHGSSENGDTVKIISSFFLGTTKTHHSQKTYKVVKECAACEYVGGQEHCDWMNRAIGKAKQKAIHIQIQNAKSPSDDAYGKNS